MSVRIQSSCHVHIGHPLRPFDMEFLRESSHVIQRLICSTLDFDYIIVSLPLTPLPQVIRISGGVFPNFALTRFESATCNSDGRFLLKVNVGGLGEPYSKAIAKALKWIKVQEKKMPLLYSRLEFGANWEAATQTIAQKMNI